MKSLRWAVSLSDTMNSAKFEEVFRRATLCALEEDVEQQRKYTYRQDSLTCLISRIIMRKAASEYLSIPWSKVEFYRTEKGKPYLKNEGYKYQFNVSHQGDFVVLATDHCYPIGVDVMKIDENRSETAVEHISKLKRQFTDEESIMMKGQPDELRRWQAFYRVWCLKEAILKATGIGLTDNLRKYDFQVNSSDAHRPGCFITSTKYVHERVEQTNWVIEESYINNDHCVAVAIEHPTPHPPSPPTQFFEILTLDSLLNTATFLNISPDFDDIDEYQLFVDKKNKPF